MAGRATSSWVGQPAGTLIEVSIGTEPEHQALRAAGPVLPGMPNLHSHAFQRAMAGLTEYRAPGQNNFWSWRRLMYRFALRAAPRGAAGDRHPAVHRDAQVRLHLGVRVSLPPSRSARPALCQPTRAVRADHRGRRRCGHRPHAAARVVRTQRLRRAAAASRTAPVRIYARRRARHAGRTASCASARTIGCAMAWRRIPCARYRPSRWPGWWKASMRSMCARPIHIHVAEQSAEVADSLAVLASASGHVVAGPLRAQMRAGAWCMPRI